MIDHSSRTKNDTYKRTLQNFPRDRIIIVLKKTRIYNEYCFKI